MARKIRSSQNKTTHIFGHYIIWRTRQIITEPLFDFVTNPPKKVQQHCGKKNKRLYILVERFFFLFRHDARSEYA